MTTCFESHIKLTVVEADDERHHEMTRCQLRVLLELLKLASTEAQMEEDRR